MKQEKSPEVSEASSGDEQPVIIKPQKPVQEPKKDSTKKAQQTKKAPEPTKSQEQKKNAAVVQKVEVKETATQP